MDALPALRRDIELVAARLGGRDVVLIRDGLGLAEPGAALSGEIVPCLPLFDGSRTVGDLQLLMMRRRGGDLVFRSEAEGMVGELDRLGILESERYLRARERIAREFASGAERKASLAGQAYPADPGELGARLDGILGRSDPPLGTVPEDPCALAAPHIDLRVAERTYGIAYRAIRTCRPPAVLLLGTGHALAGHRYSVSGKTFSTPLGRVPADREGAVRLRDAAGPAVAPDDFAHRSEHSLEFQLLFLQRLMPMEAIPILPVLCGPMEDLFGRVRSPLDRPEIAAFVGSLREWLDGPPAGKLVVAGVDLSHVGPKFGDPGPARGMEPSFRAADRAILDALAAGNAQGLYDAVAGAGNRFKVCGLSALWTLLAVRPGLRGAVLDYDVWHEEPTLSAVTYAAAVFSRPAG